LSIVNLRTEPTFETTRFSGFLDSTIVNNQLLRRVTDWTCGIQESCSDHKILSFNLGMDRQDKPINNTEYMGLIYIIKNVDYGTFEAILAYNITNTFNGENRKEDLEEIDQKLCNKIHFYEDVDELVDTTFSCVTAACNAAFKISRGLKRSITKPAVPWWTEELTVLRKRTNALRRRYQRTTNNENLRQERKEMYFDGRREYEGKMQEANLKSWKTFCTISDGVNPWNLVYKIASGKNQNYY